MVKVMLVYIGRHLEIYNKDQYSFYVLLIQIMTEIKFDVS